MAKRTTKKADWVSVKKEQTRKGQGYAWAVTPKGDKAVMTYGGHVMVFTGRARARREARLLGGSVCKVAIQIQD